MSRTYKDIRKEGDKYSWIENVIIIVRKRTDKIINKVFEILLSKK